MSTDEAAPTGIGRRDLIKKAAVAGGLAWAAPTVLASPAFAGASGCPGCADGPNGQLFGIKFEEGSATCKTPGANSTGAGNCGAIDGITNFRDGCCLVTAGLVTLDSYATGGPAEVTLASGVTFCNGYAKCGQPCVSTSPNVVAVDNPDGTTTVTFNCTGQQGGLSHLEVFVCVEGTVIPAGCPTGVVTGG